MKNKRIYICENTTDGIFTAIYDAWASSYGHDYNQIAVREPDNYQFFSEFIYVKTDLDKAVKVSRSICGKISWQAYEMVFHSTLSKNENKADIIYRFLILGFAMGNKVLEHVSNPYVNGVFSMDINVKNEFFHYEGFLRFVELKNRILFARMRPENNILGPVADHFGDRLTDENWIIYDEDRQTAAIHQARTQWFIAENFEFNEAMDFSELEKQDSLYDLWKCFVDSIGIKERKNDKLRGQMLPNRFREFMPEVPYNKSKTRSKK
ncbi:TIGR03915 family putative DNA repair protein [Anaeromicropila populeti]|uniref:Probable DNA metabolism protein n=1 Tax=Anaeromicropila populeti TaxID=37658 RepID=A0A1I6KR54_9FIRM|nr:TIGR03915 family putative DNA repair protein [Anaeromicropila populeti]SFR93713.1 probable DNA metabolism protein [Anaeromicropila populeti]